MTARRLDRKVYQRVEIVDGEEFGQYRKRLDAERRRQRVTWAYEHPVRAIMGTVLAIALVVVIVTASAFLWWLILIVGLPWLLFREWRKVRRDRRHWKCQGGDADFKRFGGTDEFRD